MKKIITIALIGLAFAGCKRNVQLSRFPEIEFSAQVEGALGTKAVALNTDQLNDVTILRLDATTATTPTSFAMADELTGATRKGSGDNGGAIVFNGTAPKYDVNDKYAHIKAYHPTPANVISNSKATWDIDGKTDILITKDYHAGKYSSPVTGTLTFAHQLAQLEVICQAKVSQAVATATWGKIVGIELISYPALVYTYNTNAVTLTGSSTTKIPLVQSDYNTDLVTFDIPDVPNTTVNAAGMFAPDLTPNSTAKVKLNVKTQKDGESVVDTSIDVQLKDNGTDKGFEKGKRHTITLTFGVASGSEPVIEVKTTEIEDWVAGYSGTGDLEK